MLCVHYRRVVASTHGHREPAHGNSGVYGDLLGALRAVIMAATGISSQYHRDAVVRTPSRCAEFQVHFV